MAYNPEPNNRTESPQKPEVSSYDSGHEHSIEHLVELRMLVESDDDQSVADKWNRMAVSA